MTAAAFETWGVTGMRSLRDEEDYRDWLENAGRPSYDLPASLYLVLAAVTLMLIVWMVG